MPPGVYDRTHLKRKKDDVSKIGPPPSAEERAFGPTRPVGDLPPNNGGAVVPPPAALPVFVVVALSTGSSAPLKDVKFPLPADQQRGFVEVLGQLIDDNTALKKRLAEVEERRQEAAYLGRVVVDAAGDLQAKAGRLCAVLLDD